MKQLLFVGLGNPGEKYENTRHNLGVVVLRAWVAGLAETAQVTEWMVKPRLQAEVAEVRLSETRVACMFPTTFMNESGQTVAAYLQNSSLSLEDVVVLHDDIELPLGTIKLTLEGSAKGHNGVRSLFATLDTQAIPRLRLGVGRPADDGDTHDFVLARFAPSEQEQVSKLQHEAGEVLSDIAQRGVVDVVRSFST